MSTRHRSSAFNQRPVSTRESSQRLIRSVVGTTEEFNYFIVSDRPTWKTSGRTSTPDVFPSMSYNLIKTRLGTQLLLLSRSLDQKLPQLTIQCFRWRYVAQYKPVRPHQYAESSPALIQAPPAAAARAVAAPVSPVTGSRAAGSYANEPLATGSYSNAPPVAAALSAPMLNIQVTPFQGICLILIGNSW